jgi:hypothetical protein
MGLAQVEINQKQSDVHDLTERIRFFIKDLDLKGLSVSVIDGNKENPYIMSVVGEGIKIEHILILLNYCTLNLAKVQHDNPNIDYPSRKAISDLADATAYLLKANNLNVKLGEQMEA